MKSSSGQLEKRSYGDFSTRKEYLRSLITTGFEFRQKFKKVSLQYVIQKLFKKIIENVLPVTSSSSNRAVSAVVDLEILEEDFHLES